MFQLLLPLFDVRIELRQVRVVQLDLVRRTVVDPALDRKVQALLRLAVVDDDHVDVPVVRRLVAVVAPEADEADLAEAVEVARLADVRLAADLLFRLEDARDLHLVALPAGHVFQPDGQRLRHVARLQAVLPVPGLHVDPVIDGSLDLAAVPHIRETVSPPDGILLYRHKENNYENISILNVLYLSLAYKFAYRCVV